MYGLFGSGTRYKIFKINDVKLLKIAGLSWTLEETSIDSYNVNEHNIYIKYKSEKLILNCIHKNCDILSIIGLQERLRYFHLQPRYGIKVYDDSLDAEEKKIKLKLKRLGQRYPEEFL